LNIIQHKNLVKWLDKIAQKSILIAPRDIEGVLLYRQVTKSDEIIWEYTKPKLSAKDAFFPPTEQLMIIKKNGQGIKISETRPNQEQVIFGLRSCDARGIAAMDAAFIEELPTDVNYASRRSQSVLIGLACSEIGDTCFCTDTGGAPDDPTGMDIMLTKMEMGYQVKVITPTGMDIVKNEWGMNNCEIYDIHFQCPTPSPISQNSKIWPPQFNSEYWDEIGERCLSCRICAYVCPTCRCFDVRDEVLETGIGWNIFERIRCWDSCTGELYRSISGGHNPRSRKGERIRNRFFCKFFYFPEQFGSSACTGCGRCIDACPVNIDITEVMAHIETNSN